MEDNNFIEPDFFDVIILGTGLEESILAAASAVAGKTVLHLDFREFYGSHWASVTMKDFVPWLDSKMDKIKVLSAKTGGKDSILPSVNTSGVSNSTSTFSQVYDFSDPSAEDITLGYSLDLSGPRLSFCAGPMVELLIRSGCHNYLEFKATEGIFMWQDEKIQVVPSSRGDIFHASMSLSEKRVVSRFLKKLSDCIVAGLNKEGGLLGSTINESFGVSDTSVPFLDFLTSQKLSLGMREFVLYALALIEDDQEEAALQNSTLVSSREGLEKVVLYLSSIGRFGGAASPFLYPLYGHGELPQAFCRLAAVKGATYVLRRHADVIVDKESWEVKGVQIGSQTLHTSKLIVGPEYFSEPLNISQSEDTEQEHIARCICITDASLVDGKSTVFLVFPPKSLRCTNTNHKAIRCLQVSSTANVAPKNRFVVQFSTSSSRQLTAESVLRPAVESLFSKANATEAVAVNSNDLQESAKDVEIGVTGSLSEAQPRNADSEDGLRPSGEPTSSGDCDETEGPQTSILELQEATEFTNIADCKPRLLWCAYYNQRKKSSGSVDTDLAGRVPKGVYVCGMPDACVDYVPTVESVKKMFGEIFPEERFFPENLDSFEESHGSMDHAEYETSEISYEVQ